MKRILASTILLSIVACVQTTKQQSEDNNSPTINDWNTFKQSNYSISYPPTWELNKSGEMGTIFIILSPLESDNDIFRENINFMTQDLSGLNIDLDKYTAISEEQVKTLISNSTFIESKRIKNEKGEYHKLIYTGDQGIYHLIFEQYYWVVDDKAYVLTFTSEQEKFDNFKKTGEKILNSFKINK